MALRPSLSPAPKGGAIRGKFLPATCLLGVLLAAGPAAAQSTQVPGVPQLPPAATLPDLVITKVSLIAGCQNKKVNAYLSAQVKNVGPVAADLSKITWQIIVEANWGGTGLALLEKTSAPPIKPQVGLPKKTLAAGEVFDTKLTILGIPRFRVGGYKNAQYVFVVRADPTHGVVEGNENNNEMLTYSKGTVCDLAP